MKAFSSVQGRQLKPLSWVLAAGLLSSVVVAPQSFAAEHSFGAYKATSQAQPAPAKSKQKAKPKIGKDSSGQDSKDDDEKSTTEKLQEGMETAKEAYEKVGVEIANGNYGKALDGAADMAKDKMIEKAEDALKKKNENLYKAYKLGKDIKDDMLKGDYAKVWKTAKKAAFNEAKDYVENKVIEKLIPGYGQLKGAWDTGYAAGGYIGKVPISADGRTINNLAEDTIRSSFYGGKDKASAKKFADEDIIQAFVKSVQSGDIGLPEGMNYGETTAKIRFNLDYGFPPLDTIELSPGTKQLKLIAERKAETERAEKAAADEAARKAEKERLLAANDPWAAGPAPAKPTAQNNPAQPQEPAEDIWATDGGNNSQLDEQRYRLQQQLEAEKRRERAVADNQSRRQFAAAEAKREEEARIKAQKAAEFREGLAAIADGLGQVAQQIQQERNATATRQQQSVQRGDYSAVNAYDRKVQDCVNNSGRPGFAVTDIHAAKIGCSQKLGQRPQPTYKTQAGSSNSWGSTTANRNGNTDGRAPNFDGLINDPATRRSPPSRGGAKAADAYSGDGWGDEDPIEQPSVVYAGDTNGYYAQIEQMQVICGVNVKGGGWTLSSFNGYNYVLSKPEAAKRATSNSRGAPEPKMVFFPNCQIASNLEQTGGDSYTNKIWYKNGTLKTEGEYWSYNWPKLEKKYRQDGSLLETTQSKSADHKRTYGETRTSYDKAGNVIRTD